MDVELFKSLWIKHNEGKAAWMNWLMTKGLFIKPVAETKEEQMQGDALARYFGG